MKPVRFGLEKGKVVIKEMKKKKKKEPEIHYHITYENIYTIGGAEHKTPVSKEFEYGFCPECNNRFYDIDQKYCEECGYALLLP